MKDDAESKTEIAACIGRLGSSENQSAVDFQGVHENSGPERLIELSGVRLLGLKELYFCYERD